MRVGIVLAAIGGIVLVPAVPARACRCWGQTISVPTDGATDVPTNLAAIVVTGFTNYGPVTLESPTAPVPLAPAATPMYSFEVSRFSVLSALAPETTYVVKISEREVSTFTTSTGPDTTPPSALTIDSFRLGRAHYDGYFNSCQPTKTRVDASLSGVAEPLIDVTLTGNDTVQQYVLPQGSPYPGTSWLADNHCMVGVTLEKGETYCIDIRARDIAGNVGAYSTACAETRACRDIETSEDEGVSV